MAKETQKVKIERLEQELKEKEDKIKELYNKIDENIQVIQDMQNNADNEFANSPHRKQLEDKVFILENKVRQATEKVERIEKRMVDRDVKIQELKNENKRTGKNSIIKQNERGAGRKERLSIAEKESVKMYRMQGKKIKEIAGLYNCSTGLIHKIINEK